jgi:alkaline phosphatase D|tara:strand:+ start:1906 stop:2940 length:1035 start_codon:yes stop_codon:yes gene_type:complete
MKKYIVIVLLICIWGCSSKIGTLDKNNFDNSDQMRIGFGSCLSQNKPMPIFNSIKSEGFDLFLMLGDNVYGDSNTEGLEELVSAYKRQKQNFDNMKFDFPFEATWDDHDYGLNDGGNEYLFKKESKELFLDFWNIPPNDPRRLRSGLYHDMSMDFKGKRMQFIFLDTRSFRDSLKPTDEKGAVGKERYIPHRDSSLSILGDEQWQWLKKTILEPTDYRIIISSIQFLPIGHGWECWYNLPYERERMIELIDNSNSDHTIILSGDRHRGGLYQFKTEQGNLISEMTSSSLNVAYPNAEENGPLRIGSTFIEENYGAIYLDGLKNTFSLMLKNMDGKVLQSLQLDN